MGAVGRQLAAVGVHHRTAGRPGTHRRLVRHLAGSSARLGTDGGPVVANLCHRFVEDTDWEYSEFALYDLGQAVAHLTVQARALGLQCGSSGRSTAPASPPSSPCPPTGRSRPWRRWARADEERGNTDTAVERQRRPVDDLVWPTAHR